jgi:HD superfamily phosphodiesterase
MRFKTLVLICMTGPACLSTAAGTAADAGWRGKVTAFAADHFKNPAWGFSHSKRDYALARKLAAADHVTLDDDVLFAAAYLHDMDAFPPWDQEKGEHGDVSAAKIDLVLAHSDFPKAKLRAQRDAIRTHMFNRDPVGPEARYLHDADTLDWLGVIGIVRIFGLVDPKEASLRAPTR